MAECLSFRHCCLYIVIIDVKTVIIYVVLGIASFVLNRQIINFAS